MKENPPTWAGSRKMRRSRVNDGRSRRVRTAVFESPKRGGALLVDKPPGPTSHDVVAWARKVLGTRRVGHTGTLDPFASGLLILLFGPAARLAEYLSSLPKTYAAKARLGTRTDTHDSQGRVVQSEESLEMPSRDDVTSELACFRGRSDQVPPQYSAKKVGGEAMYKKARRGESVKLTPVTVEISDIGLTDFEPPDLSFEVTCSAGTYIRALARDFGDALRVGAHLTALRRTRVGDFSVQGAMPGDELREGVRPIPGQWIDAAEAIAHLPTVHVAAEAALRLRQGGRIPFPEAGLQADMPIAVLDEVGLLGIGEVRDGEIAPRKMLEGAVTT